MKMVLLAVTAGALVIINPQLMMSHDIGPRGHAASVLMIDAVPATSAGSRGKSVSVIASISAFASRTFSPVAPIREDVEKCLFCCYTDDSYGFCYGWPNDPNHPPALCLTTDWENEGNLGFVCSYVGVLGYYSCEGPEGEACWGAQSLGELAILPSTLGIDGLVSARDGDIDKHIEAGFSLRTDCRGNVSGIAMSDSYGASARQATATLAF